MSSGEKESSRQNKKLDPHKEAQLLKFIEQELREHPIERRTSDRRETERRESCRRKPERRVAGRRSSDRRNEERRQNISDTRLVYFRQKYLDLIKAIRGSGLDLRSDI